MAQRLPDRKSTQGFNASRVKLFTFLALCAQLLALPLVLHAADVVRPKTTQKYLLGGAWVEFITDDSQALTLSRSCRTKARKKGPGCQAFRALARATLVGLRADEGLGTNPGVLICGKLAAEVMVGTNGRGDENAFCRFKDGTWVDTGTLHYYARKNDALAQ